MSNTHIICKAQHDFRCPVPPGRDILSHEPLIACRFRCAATRRIPSCQTKVTNFEFAVSIDEQIARLEVAMKNICGVDIFQPTERLVEERLEMGVSEWLS